LSEILVRGYTFETHPSPWGFEHHITCTIRTLRFSCQCPVGLISQVFEVSGWNSSINLMGLQITFGNGFGSGNFHLESFRRLGGGFVLAIRC
jgi:hypothetical protein